MKKEILEKLKGKLLERRKQLLVDVTNIQTNSLRRRDDASGDLSAMPIHMADIGSDTFEKEFAVDLIESEQEELREIDAALERMVDGSFGVCEVCSAVLTYQRLMAVPYARLCVDCKRHEEEDIA
jgi:RNA polymerase-binding transcription factor DksA